ncbi:ABC transporter substrate-binding protein [Bosea lathyri]|uniref:Peptide/nickel transport system substrate-binding protein n=1 Tax=Bosea lathyri TaxID=1036778 RepID=A0A1H6DB22_9HYPH|nr:ABC transporter substrate-binding protein [Bosea lathyri]SEG82063.1 peptide/nickel transport system substrate-binding protein [Bosea lathyri]
MKASRRDVLIGGASVAAGGYFSIGARAQNVPASRTLNVVKSTDLRVFDPVWTTANITADHGAMIYDTLFGLDENYQAKGQMVGRWDVSEDKKTYTFELRDGLGWHDGSPVTAADCVASIRRWGEVDAGGQLVMSRAQDISKKDDKTFEVKLKEPFGALIDVLAKLSTPCLFVMREKDAKRPGTEQVSDNIGSGPFIFNKALAKPGVSFTYDRNPNYVPRNEPPSGMAGGKAVKVDRIVWQYIADSQTGMAALQAGEIDYLERLPMDLLPVLEADPNIKVDILDKGGDDAYIRVNFLHKPFNNVKARQALLYLVDQEGFMRAAFADPRYYKPVKSLFGNNNPISNDESTGWYKPGGDLEKARQLFKDSGYAGEPVVILQPTNSPWQDNASQYLASILRKAGVNAQLAPSDWGGVVTRRANKQPIAEGGWSMFISLDSDYSHGEPLTTSFLLANGEKAWYGWPQDDQYEALRSKYADAASLDERKALARQMQARWWDFVGAVNIGTRQSPVAYRKNISGFIHIPEVIPMWNVKKG